MSDQQFFAMVGRHPIAFLMAVLAMIVMSGLRVAWPINSERPRSVAFLVGALDSLLFFVFVALLALWSVQP